MLGFPVIYGDAKLTELEMLMRYVELRRAGLMGQLWIEGSYYYAPLGTPHAYNGRQPISRADFGALVQQAGRKPVVSETVIWGVKVA